MAVPPPGGVPGPFGPGGTGFPPPGGSGFGGSGFSPPGGGFPPPSGFGAGVVVHQARLLPRLLLVGFVLLVSFGVTGAIVVLAFLGVDDVEVGDGRGPGVTEAGSATPAGPSLPTGWPEALTPPEGATILNSVSSSVGTPDEHLVLVLEVDGEPAAVAARLREQLLLAGLSITTDAVTAEGFGSINAEGAGWDATVAVGPAAGRPGTTTMNWVLSAS